MVYPAAEKLMLDNDAMFNSQMEKSEEWICISDSIQLQQSHISSMGQWNDIILSYLEYSNIILI